MNIEEQVLSREQMAHLQELGVDTIRSGICKSTTSYLKAWQT